MEINYVNLLYKRLEKYGNKYAKAPVIVFVKIVWWSITYFVSKLLKPISKSVGKDKNKLYIGIGTGGGFGDYLISANYIMYFRKFLKENFIKPFNIQIDCYAGSIKSAEAVFIDSGLVDNIDKNKYHRTAKQYDLYFSIIEPFPNVIWVNKAKIEKFCPKLLTLIDEYLKNEKIIEKVIRQSPKSNTQAYIMSMIQGRNRVQMADVGNLLGIESVIKFSPVITVLEDETLEKFSLKNTKYITINRCVDERNDTWNSNKMWEMESYVELVSMLKIAYRDYKIIQIGHSIERSPLIDGTDFSLVGKTTLEEAKVIIKNSSLHIDGEGGLVHLRHALKGGTSIVLFGPTLPEFYGYPENINIKTDKCYYPCDWVINTWQADCLNPDKHICMKSITPKMVFEKIESALKKKLAIYG